MATFSGERKNADELAEQQPHEQEILGKRRSGEIPPPANPAELLYWFDTFGDPLL